ncbi:MAG: CAP domain-containing protein [Planctomycetota bacterium]
MLGLILSVLLAQAGAVDRGAVEKAIEGKKVEFDFEHLNTMPNKNQAYGARTDHELGHLQAYRESQKDPLSLPDRVLAISDPCIAAKAPDDLIPILAAAFDRPAGDPPAPPPSAADLSGLPEPLRAPIGLLVAAVEAAEKERAAAFTKGRPQGNSAGDYSRSSDDEMTARLWNASRIVLRAVEVAKPALLAFQGDVDFSIEGLLVVTSGTPKDTGVPLVVDLGGDDVHELPTATAQNCVRVFVDVGGNDTYRGEGQGSAQYGIAVLWDLAGNDRYEGKKECQGAATAGVGMLIDEAGDDTYVADESAQGYALVGIGALVDRAGNDSYRGDSACMGFGYCSAFALLLDLAGDDKYHLNDPDFGDPLTNKAPQDEKHNASSGMGGGWGDNDYNTPDHPGRRGGGLGMLIDAKGDDVYESGCWAMGVGYYLGIGALVDYEGDDRHRSWVYTTGSGAHGGFGCFIDRAGDDVYDIGGWNCLGMSVDYGMGFFLDDAGNDTYIKTASGLGWTTGLGIALFQDRGGDDDYRVADGNTGSGRFYTVEDYNSDGQVTDSEKRHFGIFLDLGGMDRYANGKKNGTAWKQSDFAGGYDAPGAKPAWTVPDGWEDLTPIEVFRLGKDAAPEAKSAFAEAHAMLRFLPPADLVVRYGVNGGRLVELLQKASGLKPSEVDAFAKGLPAKPSWLAREVKAAMSEALDERRQALLAKLAEWEKSLAPLAEARKALDAARAEAQAAPTPEKQKAVAKLWGARGKEVKVSAEVRQAAKELDEVQGLFVGVDPWRTQLKLAGSNADLEAVALQTFATCQDERDQMRRSAEAEAANKKARVPQILADVNAYRELMGRPVLRIDEALGKAASTQAAALAKNGKAEDKPAVDGFGEVALLSSKEKKPGDIFKEWLADAARHAAMLDAKWTHAGAGGSGPWGCIMLGQAK